MHEGNQIAKRETLTSRQQAAAPHGQTHARCAQSHNDGKIEGGMQGVVKRMMKHFIGEALKLPQVLVLTNESFRCPNTHNSFIEARRNLGIRLTDEPLRANQLLLKDCRPHRQGRDNAQDHQCQFPIHPQHHRRDSRQQETTPDRIQQRPGKNRRDPLAVRRQSGHQPTDRPLVIE